MFILNRHSKASRIAYAIIAFSAHLMTEPAVAATGSESVNWSSLSLQAADSLFQTKNRELIAARRALVSAEADIVSAAARPNPSLSISTASLVPGRMGSSALASKHVDTTVSVSQLFERGNKAELRRDTASAAAEAVRRDGRDVERLQRFALASAYYDLLLAQTRTRISSENAALLEASFKALNIRLAAGDVAAIDVSRFKVDLLRAQNDVRTAVAEQQKAQTALAYMIGAECCANQLRATDDWPNGDSVTAEPARADTSMRPDIKAAQARIDAATKARDLARSLRTRDVTAGVQLERFPGSEPRSSGGVFISVPLFTRYYYDGEIRRAESEFEAAQENLERVRASAAADVQKAATDLQSSTERLRRLRESLVPEAEKALKSAEFAYARGAVGIMDLLDARRQHTFVLLDAATVQADFAKSLAGWKTAIAQDSKIISSFR